MRLGTVTQLAAVHGKAICTSPGVRLQRPLATHNGAEVRGSVLGHSPDESMQGHIPDSSPTAASDFWGVAEAILEAPEDKKETKLGLTTSDACNEGPPLPPVGAPQRPRLLSPSARWRNSHSEEHMVPTHVLEKKISWI